MTPATRRRSPRGRTGRPDEPPGEAGPVTVELRLSGSPEDSGILISVLERIAAGWLVA